MQPAVYVLASQKNGALYIGVTSHLVQRVWQHQSDLVEGFTSAYGVHLLVYFELHDNMLAAITREKQLKNGTASGSWRSSRRKIQHGKICGHQFFNHASSFPRRRESSPVFKLQINPPPIWIPAFAGMTVSFKPEAATKISVLSL